MELSEYNQIMVGYLTEVRSLAHQQETIHRRMDEIEEAAKALRFRYITEGDVL